MYFERMIDFLYPGIYRITPRNELLQEIENTYRDPLLHIEIDSITLDSLYPVFSSGDGHYTKVNYGMVLKFQSDQFKNTGQSPPALPGNLFSDDLPASPLSRAFEIFENKYGKGTVAIDPLQGSLIIHTKHSMLAVKDKISPEWTFLQMDENPFLLRQLFSDEVTDHYNSYQ